jgi:hypothetical protein
MRLLPPQIKSAIGQLLQCHCVPSLAPAMELSAGCRIVILDAAQH